MHALREFLLIAGLGLIVAGLTAYVITWIVTYVHIRDKHPALRDRLGANMLTPRTLWWYLRGGYRTLIEDRALFFLAFPGTLGVWSIVAGFVSVAISALMGQAGVGA